MAKRFDIHEWQAKQKLAEQEEFTPDLEDDDLKRAKIQQMMNTEKGLQKDDYKLVNSISNVADMYSYGEILDALESFYIKNDEQVYAEMARKHAKEFRDFLDSEDELDEQNSLGAAGSGTTITTGNSDAYATPFAFGNNKRKKRKGYMGYKEVNEAHGLDKKDVNILKNFLKNHMSKDKDPKVYKVLKFIIDSNIKVDQTKDLSKEKNERIRKKTRSGYMGYSEPVKEEETQEPEEDYTADVEKLEKLVDSMVDIKQDWIDLLDVVMNKAKDLEDKGLKSTEVASHLRNALKNL